MSVKQLSIFIENKQNRLLTVTRCLAAHNINILALSAADTADYGILRLVVNMPDLAYHSLKDAGFTVLETDVIAVAAEDRPGGLNQALEVLYENNVTVDYLYAFFNSRTTAVLNIFKVNDPKKGETVLKEAGIRLLTPDEVYS